MTVINHPMWYEDPWEIELSEVATLSRDGYHYDDTPPGQLADGTSTEGKEDGGWSLVEAIENLFGVVAEGVGAALRGVSEVAGTVWEVVVGGAQALIGGFANLIGAIFGGGDREPLPPILNPIATDLEGALQPFLDNIKKLNEENQATSEEVQGLLAQTSGLIEEQKVIVADMGELSEELANKVNEAAFNTYKQEASQAVQDAVRRLEEVEANIDPTLGQRLDDIADKQGALNESMGSLFEDLQNHTGVFTDLFNEIERAEESAVGKAAGDAKAKADQALADAKTLIESVKTAAATDAENKANQALADARASIAEVKTAQDRVIAGISEDLTGLMSDTETKLSEYNSALEKTISDSEAALRDDFGDAVTSTITEYVQSTSATTAPTTGWSTTPPTWIDGRYVWARTTIVRADGTSTTTSPIVTTGNTGARGATGAQGPKGDTGSQGPQGPEGHRGPQGNAGADGQDGAPGRDGAPGVGIASTVINYAKSSNGTTAPSSGWSSSVPATSAGDYVWTRTVWTYDDGHKETSYSVGMVGKTGESGSDGVAGKDGTTLTDTTITYAASSSGTTAPTTGWTTSVPAAAAGQYVWTRTVWSYKDGDGATSTETGYSVGMVGKTGARGATGATGATGVSVESVKRFYYRATTVPSKPTNISGSSWAEAEPDYDGSNRTLYYSDRVIYSDGTFSFSDPQVDSSYQAARQAHIDAVEAQDTADKAIEWHRNPSDRGVNVIFTDPETGRPHWAIPLQEVDDHRPNGSGPTYMSPEGFGSYSSYGPPGEVDHRVKYTLSFWAKADKPGSRIFLQTATQQGRTVAPDGGPISSGAITVSNPPQPDNKDVSGKYVHSDIASSYIADNIELQTEWTHYETELKFNEGVTAIRLLRIYWDHHNGVPANQYISELAITPQIPTKAEVDQAYEIGRHSTDLIPKDASGDSTWKAGLDTGPEAPEGSPFGPERTGVMTVSFTAQEGFVPVEGEDTYRVTMWIKHVEGPSGGISIHLRDADSVARWTHVRVHPANWRTREDGPNPYATINRDGIWEFKTVDFRWPSNDKIRLRIQNNVGNTFLIHDPQIRVVSPVDSTVDDTKIQLDKTTQDAIDALDAASLAIVESVTEYAASSSETTAPTSGWSTTAPARIAGTYIWAKTTLTYGDGSISETSPVLTTGNDGAKGDTGSQGPKGDTGADGKAGKDGVGVTSTAITYAVGDSGTSAPTTGWQSTVPEAVAGQFVWTRTVWSYSDGTNETVYSVGKIGEFGETELMLWEGSQEVATRQDMTFKLPYPHRGDTFYTFYLEDVNGTNGRLLWMARVIDMDGVEVTNTHPRKDEISGATYTGSAGGGWYTYRRPNNNGLKDYIRLPNDMAVTGIRMHVWDSGTTVRMTGASVHYGSEIATDSALGLIEVGSKADTAAEIAVDAKEAADLAVIDNHSEYVVSSSATTAPTSGWSKSTPTRTPGSFIWMRLVTTYGDGKTVTGSPALLTGNDGAKGDTGVGVVSILRRYQRATSRPSTPKTLSPSNDWVADEPAFRDDGTSLYYTDRVLYTDGSFSWSPVQLDSTYESYRQAHEESSTALSEAEKAVDWLKNPVEIGSSLITIDPETREPHWFNGTKSSTLKTPDGDNDTRYIDTGGQKVTTPNGPKVAVDPTITYRVSFWAYADDPGSKIFIELRDQDDRLAVKSGSIGGGGSYIASSLSMPTSWTKFESSLELEPGVRTVSVYNIYWNHNNGIPTTQRIGGFKLFPEVPTQADVDDAQNRAISAGARLDDLYAGKFEENTEFWRKQNEWNKGVEDLAILNGEVDDAQQDILDIHAGQIADTSFLATTNSAAIEAQQNVLDLQAGRLDNFASLSEAHQKALEAHGDMLDLQEGRLDDFQTLADMQDKVNQDNEALWESQLNWNELQTEWVEGLNDWRATNQAADDAQSEAIKANADLLYWLNPPKQLLPTTVEKQHGNWKDIPEWANIAGDTSSFTPVQASGPDWEGMLYGINQAVSYLDSDVTLLPYPASRYVIDETRHSDRIFRYEFYYQSGTPGTALVMYLSDQNNSTTNVVEWNRPDRTEDVTYSSNHDNHLWWASSMPAGVNKFSGTLKLSDHVTEFRTASLFLNHRHGNQTRVTQLGLYGLRIFPNVVTQDELNRSNAALWNDATDFMERQTQINELQKETDRLQDEMDKKTREQMEDLAAAIDEIREYTSRVFWISGSTSTGQQYGGGANDDFVVYGNYGNYDIQSKGNWTGEFIFNGRTHRTGRDEYNEPILYQGNVGTTTQWKVSGNNIYRAPAYIQYWKRSESAMVLNKSRGSYLPGTGSGWYTNSLFTHTIKETGDYAVHYSVKWEGATYLDFYGIRVRRGSTTIVSHGPVDKVGPVTPLGNGQKTMSVSLSKRRLYAGDSITFQTYTGSGPTPMTNDQRRVLSSEARIVRLS